MCPRIFNRRLGQRLPFFYLRSRGLDVLSAKALLVRGFATELLDLVKHDGTRDFITDRFDSWLSENTTA